jgi:hypothetical protein
MPAGDTTVTYRYVRVGLVALVVFLLVSLALTAARSCVQESISAFFYTRTHGVFIAALCAMGMCLIAYQGSRLGEDALLNFAGFQAFLVALIPTAVGDVCRPWLPSVTDPFGAVANNVIALFVAAAAGVVFYLGLQRWRPAQDAPTASAPDCAQADTGWKRVAAVLLAVEGALPWTLFVVAVAEGLLLLAPWFRDRAHTVAAVAMFLAITLVALYHACYARAAVRHRRARFYAMIAVAMLLTVIAAVVLLGTRLPYAVLGVEIVLIALFGVFWGVQTWDVWNEEDRYPAAGVPALADSG